MEICGNEPVLRYLVRSEFSQQGRKTKLEIPTLNDLIRELYKVFEEDNINVEHVKNIMSAYKSNPREWKQFAKFDPHRYTRNLVDAGNGKFNLMVIAWAEGQGSSIHDHANSHCFMKVLSGNLKEVKFAWPEQSSEDSTGVQETISEMAIIDETSLKTNEVTYINDTIGLHRMENESHAEAAVSLHLYCPPFESVALFDQRTGHKTMAKVTFWSKYGQRTPFGACKQKEEADYENN